VIVVNWNGGDGLLSCLGSVLDAADGMSLELWMVDNASSDGSPDRAAAAHHEVRLIRNRTNVGFARAANQAMARSSGAFVLLLNPDARIDRDALGRLVATMRSDPWVGIVGCPSVDADGREAPGYEVSYPGERARSVTRGGGDARDVAWVSGACLLARRRMMDAVGMLDDDFFMYYEDVDWAYRARMAGWRVVTSADARVQHALGGSSQRVPSSDTVRRAAESRLLFYYKHYPRWRARWLRMRMIADGLLRAGLRLGPAALGRSARDSLGSECARLYAALKGPALGRQRYTAPFGGSYAG
jgi:GT2 family glycosyltransferase